MLNNTIWVCYNSALTWQECLYVLGKSVMSCTQVLIQVPTTKNILKGNVNPPLNNFKICCHNPESILNIRIIGQGNPMLCFWSFKEGETRIEWNKRFHKTLMLCKHLSHNHKYLGEIICDIQNKGNNIAVTCYKMIWNIMWFNYCSEPSFFL